jgi:hypothetical protein
MHVLQVLSFLFVGIPSLIEAYPNQAGACHGNQAAVKGSHVSNSYYSSDADFTKQRPIHSGSLEENEKLQVLMNGVELSSLSTTELLYNTEYFVEILSTTQPFKGVLLRFESLAFTTAERAKGPASFILKPLTNAQTAVACGTSSTIQGVTHTDNSLKYVFSSELLLDPPTDTTKSTSYYAMDITVVDVNNLTASIYWYTQYAFQGVTELSNQVQDIPAEAPKPSEAPTSSPYPTYQSKCYVCGSEDYRVVNETDKVFIFGEVSICGELQEDGLRGLLPPQRCGIIQAAARDACGCESGAVPTDAPVVAPSFHTSRPTVTASPTKSAFPTYTEKCYVCDGDRHQVVSNGLQLVTLQGVVGTCLQLHDDGAEGLIPPDICPEAQQQAAMYCNCTDIPEKLLEPTVSPAPSISPYPTFSQKCFVCDNDESQHITALHQIVNVNGAIGTCLDLELQGLQGFINPSLCEEAQATAALVCECQSKNIPTDIKTLAPTTTPYPTSSFSPTYHDACYICVKPNHIVTIPEAGIQINNYALTCEELQQATLDYIIPPHICPEAQKQALESCGCTSTAALPSMLPTYNQKCFVCGEDGDRVISHPKNLVLLGSEIMNCNELAEAGSWGLIPPSQCDDAMKMASDFCGCVEKGAEPAPTPPPMALSTLEPTVTLYPTITSSPTYSEKCYICAGYNSTSSKANPKDSPASDLTRSVRNSKSASKNGAIAYNGYILDCDVVQELGETGSIPPHICPVIQESARKSCSCNEHLDREEAPDPKSPVSSARSERHVNLTILVLCTMVAVWFRAFLRDDLL